MQALVAPIEASIERVAVTSPITTRLEEELWLQWSSAGEARHRGVPEGFLRDFCALGWSVTDARDRYRVDARMGLRIVRVAKEWGVLGERLAWWGGVLRDRKATPDHDQKEPLRRWRAVATTTAALGRLMVGLLGERQQCWRDDERDWADALSLREGPIVRTSLGVEWHSRPGRKETLMDKVAPGPQWISVVARPSDIRTLRLRERRELLGDVIRQWFKFVGLELEADFGDLGEQPFFGLRTLGPVGAAATLLLSTISGRWKLTACCHPGCALPYLLAAPQMNERHTFCPDHKEEALRWQWDKRRGKPKWAREPGEGGDRHV